MAGLGLAKKVALSALGLATGGAAGNYQQIFHLNETFIKKTKCLRYFPQKNFNFLFTLKISVKFSTVKPVKSEF